MNLKVLQNKNKKVVDFNTETVDAKLSIRTCLLDSLLITFIGGLTSFSSVSKYCEKWGG